MTDGLIRLVQVMDRLRSPGGCPWDAEQTHETLVRFALEETYELVDAIENGTREDLREELGDVLLQVVFHARVAQEHPEDPFTLDEVANGVADKLIERHPHVFADAEAGTADEVYSRWERIKKETKRRESVFDGVPLDQPALARAQKIASRADRAGVVLPGAPASSDGDDAAARIGAELLALAVRAQAAGVDAEAALRAATRAFEGAARDAEQQRPADTGRSSD
ncbi:MazG family protein [Demequina lignilytica]|uniref:MazG family protein n=1 Tax=Demequina lignilytica TaxID=3051663 RepID=A0AB35MIJ8_9MICO|nr:MazG family protein [Demequina sp. SYSU T0a273]MDN4483644.1 MazG family protein [Demequina sp. SYSU T0a273]